MSVYKRADKWYIDYYLPGGKRIREAAGSSKKLAEKLLAKRQAEVLEEKFNIERPDNMLFEEMVERFLEIVKTDLKQTTWERYEVSFHKLKPFFEGKFIHTISAYDLEQYKKERLKQVSPSTVNLNLAFLRRMMNQAKKWEMVDKNPLDDVGFYREDNAPPDILLTNKKLKFDLTCPYLVIHSKC